MMFPRRGDAGCTSRPCELRHLAVWAEHVITRRQIDVSVDGVGVRHPRLQQLSPCLVAGSRQYPRVGEVELMPFLQRQQLAFLSYNAKFRAREAQPEDFIASFKSALQNCEADEDCKSAMRQQGSALLLQHKRQMTISKAEDRDRLKIRKMKDIVTLPADKGRSTVAIYKTEYRTKKATS
nr:unnamed protein product [Spirometra erinaceieuropaei]